MTTNPEPTLADVINRLDTIISDIDLRLRDIREQTAQANKCLDDEVRRWDERFFQLTRDHLSTAKTIIVTAGTVVILSPVLQALAPAIQAVVARLIGTDIQP